MVPVRIRIIHIREGLGVLQGIDEENDRKQQYADTHDAGPGTGLDAVPTACTHTQLPGEEYDRDAQDS